MSTSTFALKLIEEQLNCPICLCHFVRPKILPCQHAFCFDCISKLKLSPDKDRWILCCPICRCLAPVPEGGVQCFPPGIHVSSLLEIWNALKQLTSSTRLICCKCQDDRTASGYCQICKEFLCSPCTSSHQQPAETSHHEVYNIDSVIAVAIEKSSTCQEPTIICPMHELKFDMYCDTCGVLICLHCSESTHNSHDFHQITNAARFSLHKRQVEEHLGSLREQATVVKEIIPELDNTMDDIQEKSELVKKGILAASEDLIAIIQESTRMLTQKVSEVSSEKVKFTSAQKKKAQASLAWLESCQEFVEQKLQIGSQQQILATKNLMISRMNTVAMHVKMEVLNPAENSDVRYVQNTKTVQQCHRIGRIEYTTVAQRCVASGRGLTSVMANRCTTFELSIKPTSTHDPPFIPSTLISCQILASEAACPSECDIEEDSLGRRAISYTPLTFGPHQLSITICDVHIPKSPFTIHVMPSPEQRGAPLSTTANLKGPFGIAVNDQNGVIALSEYDSHQIVLFDKDGKKMNSFGFKNELDHPTGITFTPDNHILVADQGNHRIHKLTMTGECLETVGCGSWLRRKLHFSYPKGICVHPTGKIMIVDCDNHRIQVLNSDLSFSHMFGSWGRGQGDLHYPYDVAIDSEGMVFVTDNENHRIQKFTPDGKFLMQFQSLASRNEKLEHPHGIVVDANDIVYVSDDHFICMFDNHGRYYGKFGRMGYEKDQFAYPRGIAVDKTGKLYICDYGNNRVVEYYA